MQRFFMEPTFWGRAVVIGHVYDAVVSDVQGRLIKKVEELNHEILTDSESLVGDLGWHMKIPLEIEFKKGATLQ
jgi:hypothetical protein